MAAAPPDTGAPSLVPYMIATSALCLLATTAATVLRTLTKVRVLRSIHSDDWLAIFAWICFIGFDAYFLTFIPHQGGLPTADIDMHTKNLEWILKGVFVLEVLWCPLMLATKLSVCIQLLHIFCGSKKGILYWVFNGIMVSNGILFTATFFTPFFACSPIESNWDLTIQGNCVIDEKKVGLVSAAWLLASDVLIFILPLCALWGLKLPAKKKKEIAGIFAFALLAPAASACRLTYAIEYTTSPDPLYAIQQLGLWSLAEVTIYIACGFMPLIPKFIQLLNGKARKLAYDPTINSAHANPRGTIINRRIPDRDDSQWLSADDMTIQLTRPDRYGMVAQGSMPRVSEDGSPGRSASRSSLPMGESSRRQPAIWKTVKIQTEYEDASSLEAMRIENWT